jgi:hypothetical protein
MYPPETTVDVHCTGHIRREVGKSRMDFTFEGETLRERGNDLFETTREMLEVQGSRYRQAWAAGISGFRLLFKYKWLRRNFDGTQYVQFEESEYVL